MAGSYNHIVHHKEDGRLGNREYVFGMLETRSGDVYEAVEEMYGMIWYLAAQVREYNLSEWHDETSLKDIIEEARKNYKQGIELSPGVEKNDG